MHTVLTYLWESGSPHYAYRSYLLMGIRAPIMLTVLTYLWESGSLKYLQTVKPCFKIPIECISGLENICKPYFRTLKYVKIRRISIMHTWIHYLLLLIFTSSISLSVIAKTVNNPHKQHLSVIGFY